MYKVLSENDKAAARATLPEHCVDGLFRYFDNRIPPGGFMTALLENDLKETFARADEINREAVFAYVYWLYNHAPMGSYGSPEAVSAWLNPAQ